MKWYYSVGGGHTHVRVFMDGVKCGDLCFRNEEFEYLFERYNMMEKTSTSFSDEYITFIDETKPEAA